MTTAIAVLSLILPIFGLQISIMVAALVLIKE